MRKIKVLLAVRPRMLSEVLRNAIERQPDIEIVSELIDSAELLIALRAIKAEVVITTSIDSDRGPEISGCLLAAYPQIKMITLSEAGDIALLYESGSSKKRIDEVGEEAILGAIRELMN